MEDSAFHFEGEYRVQSLSSSHPSTLAGRWIAPGNCHLSKEQVNAYLVGLSQWRGKSKVTLRPACVEERTGAFASHADALYYRRLFTPYADSPRMENDVLDVSKLDSHWARRETFLRNLFSREHFEVFVKTIADVQRTAINEYMCHEAGHLLGLDVESKWEQGYFRPGERLAWPLIYVEEFRADLESLGAALHLLPRKEACAVFVYHLCHRFGLACESAQTDSESAGAVPYLLFHLLRELRVLIVNQKANRKELCLNDFTEDGIASVMRDCAEHASNWLTLPEVTADSFLDAALSAATYYRKRALDEDRLEEFWELVSDCGQTKDANQRRSRFL
jgi:hypothetical protein